MTRVATSRSRRAAAPPYEARRRRLLALGVDAGAAALLVTSPVDVGYLTGFHGGDSYLLLGGARGRKPVIVSDFRYLEELEPLHDEVDVHIRSRSMTEAVAERVLDAGIERLGLQAEHVTLAQRRQFGAALKGVTLLETSGLCAGLREIKDAGEVALIRKAVAIQEAALNALLEELRPGMTELECAAILEAEMKRRGSSRPAFQTIVAARAHGSLPHYRPGSTRLTTNGPVLIDWGAVWRGYHADMTRTFAIGRWPKKLREAYEIVRDAHDAAAAALAPGRTTAEVDGVARSHITRHGYGEFFGHSLGHGIGLEGHEDPRLSHMLAARELREGMVVTVEPGIYLPGVGGVRLENDFLITARGAECLCRLPMSLDWATR